MLVHAVEYLLLGVGVQCMQIFLISAKGELWWVLPVIFFHMLDDPSGFGFGRLGVGVTSVRCSRCGQSVRPFLSGRQIRILSNLRSRSHPPAWRFTQRGGVCLL